MLKLLKCDRVVFTIEGLEQLSQDINDRTHNLYRNRKIKRTLLESEIQRRNAKGIKTEEIETSTYDPTKPLKFKFKILENYFQEYEKQKENEKKEKTQENSS